jgi:hypothetical protein
VCFSQHPSSLALLSILMNLSSFLSCLVKCDVAIFREMHQIRGISTTRHWIERDAVRSLQWKEVIVKTWETTQEKRVDRIWRYFTWLVFHLIFTLLSHQ